MNWRAGQSNVIDRSIIDTALVDLSDSSLVEGVARHTQETAAAPEPAEGRPQQGRQPGFERFGAGGIKAAQPEVMTDLAEAASGEPVGGLGPVGGIAAMRCSWGAGGPVGCASAQLH